MIDICFDCKYYVDGMCTQYDIVVAPTDGCSNGEKGIQRWNQEDSLKLIMAT